jgi:hypothetical protein
MNKSVALPCVVILLASIAAGCGSSGNVATTSALATPAPTPSVACTTPPGYSVQEVFPQNGQIGQPNLEGVVFAIGPNPQPGGVPSPLPTNWFFYATYSAAGGAATTTYPTNIGFLATPVPAPSSSPGATPTPLPTPSDMPAFGNNFLYESASLGIFANSGVSQSTFQIYLANNNCYPGIAESSFTTNVIDQPSPSPSPTGT